MLKNFLGCENLCMKLSHFIYHLIVACSEKKAPQMIKPSWKCWPRKPFDMRISIFVFSTIFSSTFFHQNFVGVFTSLKSSLLLLWITSDAFKKQLLVWSFLIRHFAKSSPIMCFHRTFCTSLIEICHLKYNNRTFLNLKTTTVFAFCTNYGEVFVSSFETCKTLLVSSKRIFLK